MHMHVCVYGCVGVLHLDGQFFVLDEAVEDMLEAQLQVRLVSELDLTEVAHHPASLRREGRGYDIVLCICTYIVIYSGAYNINTLYIHIRTYMYKINTSTHTSYQKTMQHNTIPKVYIHMM